MDISLPGLPSIDLGFDILGYVIDAFRGMMFTICSGIYQVVIYLYNLFLTLCNGQILDSRVVRVISNRIGLILGVIMLFIVLVSFLQMVIDPDKVNDNEKGAGAIVKKIIIVVLLFGLSPTVFDLTYDIQKVLLGQNSDNKSIIQDLFLPRRLKSDNFGGVLAQELFTSFYNVTFDQTIRDADPDTIETCETYKQAFKDQIITMNSFSLGRKCLNRKISVELNGEESEEDVIEFSWLPCIVSGIFVMYILFMYCFKVGERLIQLAFLQMVSPMAFVGYLSPKKDNMFTKWKNMYISTYIDVFIRVAIISLVVYLVSVIIGEDGDVFWKSLNDNAAGGIAIEGLTKVFIEVIMIVALFSFGKRAPELIGELFPKGGTGSIGFGIGKKDNSALFKGLGLGLGAGAGSMIGAIGGAAGGKGIGRVTGLLGGAAGGVLRGGKAGFGAKGLGSAISSAQGAQSKVNLARSQRIASGTTFGEIAGDKMRSVLGMQSGYAATDTKVNAMQGLNSLITGEDIVKDYQNMRDTAYQNLSQYESKYGTDSIEYKKAKVAALNADKRLGAVKDEMFNSIKDGKREINQISYDGYKLDGSGNIVDNRVNNEQTISKIAATDSMVNSLANVENVMHKTYDNRKAFNDDRFAAMAESQNKHKNG